jgi:TolB protein
VSLRLRRIVIIAAIVILLAIAATVLHNIGGGHPIINTAGEIAFVSDRNTPGFTHIWIMDSDGSNAKELTAGSENDTDPTFSPDGSEIAFASDRSGQPEIWVMDANGENPHAVTIGSDSKSDPEFSPDGTLVAYLARGTLMTTDLNSNDNQTLLPSQVSATGTSTTALSAIAKAPVTRFWWQPSPSSKPQNGALAAVQESEAGDLQAVTLLPKIGASPKFVLAASVASCAWSPDGSTLAMAVLGLTAPNGKQVSGLLLTNADGSPMPPPLPLSPTGSLGPQNPAFKPDGTQIGFEIWKQPSIESRTILGLGITPVTGGTGLAMLVQGPVTDLRWSPDGSHALFSRQQAADSGKEDIWVMDPDGSDQVNLTNGQGNNTEAVWSPTLPKVSAQ